MVPISNKSLWYLPIYHKRIIVIHLSLYIDSAT